LGVHETWSPRYEVEPLPEQAEIRRRFFRECLRVLREPGLLVTDCPNGLFPVDFWHDTERRAGRWHWPSEQFLPSYGELRRRLREAGFQGAVRPLSPHGRFRFQQVGRRWWGRALAKPAEAGFRLMSLPLLSFLAGSPLNPYLVVTAEP
jgi:SAM-dependent methyltransferase